MQVSEPRGSTGSPQEATDATECGLRGVCLSMFGHWRSLSNESPRADHVVVRDQIDMLTLPTAALPSFFINERTGERYINRLAGTEVVSAFGFDPKGRYLDEMMTPDQYPDRRALFDLAIEDKVFIHYRATLAAPQRDHVAFARVLFPAALTDGSGVSLVCGSMVFFDDADLSDRERELMATGYRGVLQRRFFKDGAWTTF